MDMLLGATYRSLLNLSHRSDLTIRIIPLWPPLARAPKYWQLADLKDHLDRAVDMFSIKLPTLAMP